MAVEVSIAHQATPDLLAWTASLDRDIPLLTRHVAESLRAQVAAAVPVLTGTLSRSATTTTEDAGFGVGLGEDVPYAQWIEYGGSRGRDLIPEGRYLWPTMQAAESEITYTIEDALSTSIERFPWTTA